MVRSSHHLALPSLPPPRAQFFTPSLPPRSRRVFHHHLLLLLLHRESSKEPGLRRRGIAASHLSRGPGPAERAYQYVNESPTGTTIPPPLLFLCSPLWHIYIHIYIDAISGDRYLACRPHFFRSSESSGSSLPSRVAFSTVTTPPG